MNRKNIAIVGIMLCCAYLFVVIFFVATASQNWLIAFEIVTMISGIYFVFLIISLPCSKDGDRKVYKTAAIIFVTALMVITNIAHSASLTVIQLLKDGIAIPDYFQIGKTPSVITAIEYLGWGVFMGLAFLFSALAIGKQRELKSLKITLLACGALCILGFFGWLITRIYGI